MANISNPNFAESVAESFNKQSAMHLIHAAILKAEVAGRGWHPLSYKS